MGRPKVLLYQYLKCGTIWHHITIFRELSYQINTLPNKDLLWPAPPTCTHMESLPSYTATCRVFTGASLTQASGKQTLTLKQATCAGTLTTYSSNCLLQCDTSLVRSKKLFYQQGHIGVSRAIRNNWHTGSTVNLQQYCIRMEAIIWRVSSGV